MQNKPLGEDVNVIAIARGTRGFNGADLANLVNIAAIKAAVDGSEKLTAKQLEFAKDRIMMGAERKSMLVTEELIFGQEYITTGESNDLHKATELAQYMVSTCGMSDAIGPVYMKERASAEMQSRIDEEV